MTTATEGPTQAHSQPLPDEHERRADRERTPVSLLLVLLMPLTIAALVLLFIWLTSPLR